MLSLANYASSDEDEIVDEDSSDTRNKAIELQDRKHDHKPDVPVPHISAVQDSAISPDQIASHRMRPTAGPTMPPADVSVTAYEDFEEPMELSFEASREAIRNLTMPPVPNFNIPPSPPGSPAPGSTKKFTHFLKLKKQGVHFNERLQNTTALKNPTLFQKLKQHASISDEEQYATTLSEDLAVPTSFPRCAFADELNKSQASLRQKKDDESKKRPRQTIDFVSATGSAGSSRHSTPKTATSSTAERVLSGVDGTATRSPHLVGRKK